MEKIAIITGASGGLGQACGAKLAAQGWRLALISRDLDRLAGFPKALKIAADVADPQEARAAIDTVYERLGTATALAHCAGNTLIAPFHRTPAEKYRNCIHANLDSAFFTLQAFIEALSNADQPGSAVVVSSVVAGTGVSNHAAIAAAKGGLEALVRALAAEYANRHIRVNAVAPGLMRSPMTESMLANERSRRQIAAQYPLGRYGEVEDGAAALCWLLSDDAAWISGQILAVDGGWAITILRPKSYGFFCNQLLFLKF